MEAPEKRGILILRTLGAVEIHGVDAAAAHAVLVHPHRAALLTYLALAGPGGFQRRDTLLALLWPEHDDKRARAALNLAVHRIRRALGQDALASRGKDELGLNAERWRVDALAFEEALDAGDVRSALDEYRGPLLAGFHVDGAPEFERWLDLERARLRDRAASAAWGLAEQMETAGDHTAAAEWARWAVGSTPDDERAVRRLMSLLDRIGDRAGALREYERLAGYLEAEWGAEPAPETREALTRIRQREDAAPVTDAPPTRRSPDASADGGFAEEPADGDVAHHRFRLHLSRRLAVAVAAVTLILVAGTVLRPGHATPDAAMLAYAEGEAALRSGRHREAADAFQRAVLADTGFAAAYYRLSTAANWTGQPDVALQAVEAALARADRLNERDHLAAQAWRAYLRGEPDVAEANYRALLAADPTDLHGWFYLGETLYHWGPMLGVPASESREAWQRVLAATPDDAGALIHLARLEAGAGDDVAFNALRARMLRLEPDLQTVLELRTLHAYVFGTAADRDAVGRDLVLAGLDVRARVLITLAANGREPAAVVDLARTLVPDDGSANERVRHLLLMAQLEAARGRREAALATLRPDRALSPARATEYRSALATLPFFPLPADEAASLRRALAALESAPPVGPGTLSLTLNSLYQANRLYLLGMLALRLDDAAALDTAIDALLRYEKDSPVDTAYARDFARTLGAERIRRNGRPDDALAHLGAPRNEPMRILPQILSYPKAHERWLRAELHAEAGRLEEAYRWFATFPDPAAYDLMYLAPSHERRADIREALGDPAGAARHRARAAALWRDADVAVRRR